MFFGLNDIHTNNHKDIQKGYSYLSGPLNIMWDITNRCNLNCMHCYNGSGVCPKYEDLSDDDMKKNCYDIIKMKIPVVCFCGGEPLLRLSLVEELATLLTENNIVVNMVSNGMLINEEVIGRLKKSGIINIQISLDSLTPEIHDRFRGCKGSHKKAINAIELLIKEGFNAEITFVPTKLNYHEIDKVIDFIVSLGLKKLRSMPFVSLGRGYDYKDELKLDNNQLWSFYLKVQKKLAQYPNFVFDYGDPIEHIYLFINNPVARTVTFEIKSNGDVGISPYLSYIYANIKDTSIIEMWENGLKNIWQHKRIQEDGRKIISLSDIEKQKDRPWNNTDIVLT